MVAYPNESEAYRAARNDLLDAERALRRQVEQVAAKHRDLPDGGALKEDYRLTRAEDGGVVRFSDLFPEGKDTLLVYGFMFADGGTPCPACTAFLDGFDRTVRHVSERIGIAVVAKTRADRIAAYAKARGWTDLPLYSSTGTTYNADYHCEAHGMGQIPIMNVFRRGADGIRHFCGTELFFAENEPNQHPRHIDMMWPLWNTLDLTPAGRGDFFPSIDTTAIP